jgi:hypothetical protein
MTELAKRILAVFAESYPTSAYYRGGRKLRKSGWERLFPDIASDVAAKNDFLDAVEELVHAKILTVRWKPFRAGDELDALYLDDPQAMFDALGARSPEETSRQMRALLGSPEWAEGRLSALASYLAPRLEAGHPVPVGSALDLSDLSRVFALSREEAAALPIRALSIRLFSDSKRLERLLPVADRLSRVVWSALISEDLGLGRSYPEVTFALRGRITFTGNEAWPCEGQILALPLATIKSIQAIEPAAARGTAGVLSVENKETFHVFASRLADLSPGAIVCSSGHPNPAVVALLRRFVAAGASLSHYGDLDPDGILILQEIQSALAVPVASRFMTVDIHRAHAKYGFPLDQTQRARLSQVDPRAPDVLRDLAREIGETGIGVEQEIIDPEGFRGG